MNRNVSLFYSDTAQGGTSDKEYHLQLEPNGKGFVVNFQFGRRGGTLQTGTKTPSPVPLAKATKVFESIYREKTGKGYQETSEAAKPAPVELTGAAPTAYPVELLEEVSQAEVRSLVWSQGYWLQEKEDGHRRQIRRDVAGITGLNRRGLAVPLPAVLAAECALLPLESFLMDGELKGDDFVAFDLLEANGSACDATPYGFRFARLQDALKGKWAHLRTVDTWREPEQKALAVMRLHAARAEGLVFKKISALYRPGRNGQHKKFKFVKTCSAIVIELRPKGKDSIAVGLLEGGAVVNVGTCSTIGKPVPKLGDIVEIRYLYATEAKRLYQAIYLGLRDDVGREACTMQQLVFKQGVAS